MTEEDKQLLIQELSARLPYGVFVHTWYDKPLDIRYTGINLFTNTIRLDLPEDDDAWVYINNAKPYLRSLSTMTEEEILELYKIAYDTWYSDPLYYKNEEWITFRNSIKNNSLCFKNSVWLSDIDKVIDWLNAKYFDYNELIKRDLAKEAPKGMYKIK